MQNDFSFNIDATKRAGEPAPGSQIPVVVRSRQPEAELTLGRYRIESILGKGGFGVVYSAQDTQLDRRVAIKVLKDREGVPQSVIDTFLSEARRLAGLNHRGIVTIHDVGSHEGMVYLVSDFLDGPDLQNWLKTNRPDWKLASRITADVADALSHAHSRKTVHRDIKPANILLVDDLQPVLVDFGIGLDENHAGAGELGTVTGTPRYMSPEQVEGKAHRIDGRTDIYSLGVVLYELLCGEAPFRSVSVPEILRQVREDDPQPPRQLRRELPEQLEAICLKAMAKDIHNRFTTAADFAQELRRVVASVTDTTPSPTLISSTPLSNTPAPDRDTPTGKSDSLRTRSRAAERRRVTLLLCNCDFFSSADYLERMDAEDQVEILKLFRDTCEAVVQRFEGAIMQCNESGLIACLGYPVAHEDAARRAALIGLRLTEELSAIKLNPSRVNNLLNPAIVIHTGSAIAESRETGISVVGDVRNIATKLAAIAIPGQTICTGATSRLIETTCICESFGSRALMESSPPVELFRITGTRDGLGSIDARAHLDLTPLAGRVHEVSLLKDCWDRVQDGTASVVLIIGEPGLGKSRLVHTMKQHALQLPDSSNPAAFDTRSPDVPRTSRLNGVVEWRCSPHHQNSVLHPAIDYFQRILGFSQETSPGERLERLVRYLTGFGLGGREQVSLFASLLSLPPNEKHPAIDLPPVRQREETLRVVEEWFRAVSGRQLILFIVEDLHWIDATTLEFLRRFVIEGFPDRILSLLTFRPEFKTPWPAAVNQTTLPLNRLARQQVADVTRHRTGNEKLPQALLDQVYERTGGVPLFVEEFAKMMRESGILDHVDDDSAQIRELLAREIPASLQDLVMARLDRLEGDPEVVQLAATLGRGFRYEVLAAATTLDATSLQSELAKLVHAELLQQKGRPPDCSYLFRHALLQDAAYSSLTRARRQELHQRVARVLEEQFTETIYTQPELLAHHFAEGGSPEKAVKYCLAAGLRSRSRSAEAEAISHLEKGLLLLPSIPESQQRDNLELQLLNPLGTAYIASRGYAAPEVGPNFSRARELCERIGDSHTLFAILWGTCVWNVVRGELNLAMGLAGEAVALADRMSDPGMMMEALFLPGVTHVFRGEFRDGYECCSRALRDYDDRDRTRFWSTITGEDSGVAVRCYLAVAQYHLGFPGQSQSTIKQALALAREIGQPFTLNFALEHQAWLNNQCGLAVEARAAAEEEIAIATEQGYAYWLASASLFKADSLVLQGRSVEALPQLLNGLEKLRATGAGLDLTLHCAFLGQAYLDAGEHELAGAALEEGLAIGERCHEKFFEAELYRLQGEVLYAEGRHKSSAADAAFRRAIETARRQESKAMELRATTSLARLWCREGRTSDARAAVAAVLNSYPESAAMPDFVDADELMRGILV